jgi:hypothetical protein
MPLGGAAAAAWSRGKKGRKESWAINFSLGRQSAESFSASLFLDSWSNIFKNR